MPWRTSMSCSTSTLSKSAPQCSRMATARLEKPHCGNSGVPFMNSTTSWSLTIWQMRVLASDMAGGPEWRFLGMSGGNGGGQLQGVQLAAHAVSERLVDQLVLLHPALAGKRGTGDVR